MRFVSLVLGLGLEHSCPWPRECLSSERLSLALALASDFFCVLGLGLGLEPCVLDSTSGYSRKCSPKKKKNVFKYRFSGNLQFIGAAKIFNWGGLNHKSHAMTSSKICLLALKRTFNPNFEKLRKNLTKFVYHHDPIAILATHQVKKVEEKKFHVFLLESKFRPFCFK